jgi:hypothetical protein
MRWDNQPVQTEGEWEKDSLTLTTAKQKTVVMILRRKCDRRQKGR